ncbi:MAG: hypothetical protein KGY81_10885, partial [Phycisphaerae bacterium]|nr:hypothetical protein [Phycisphaerae bacterium]
QEAIAFGLVHLETGANDPIALLFEDDPFCFHFRAFCVFRSYSPPGQRAIESDRHRRSDRARGRPLLWQHIIADDKQIDVAIGIRPPVGQ